MVNLYKLAGEKKRNVQKIVKVLLVGPLRKEFGINEMELEISGEESVSDVLERIINMRRGGDLDELYDNLVVSVDGEVVRDFSRRLKGGETIIITPPLAGGSELTVRCLNCSTRIQVEKDTQEATCPSCGTTFIITWISPNQPKIKRIK